MPNGQYSQWKSLTIKSLEEKLDTMSSDRGYFPLTPLRLYNEA